MIKYFHELTKEELDEIDKRHITWDELAKDYPQPLWCNFPNAVAGVMGCWSLMSGYVTGRNYCKNCDCYIPKKNSTKEGG